MGESRNHSATTPFVQRDVPIGTIMFWSGSIVSIPSTYRLCDGTLGTPDLRNRFLVGAGATYSVDDTGGALTHAHDFTSANHDHRLSAGGIVDSNGDFHRDTDSIPITGTTNNGSSLPPYHSLVLVMYNGRPI